MMLGLWWAVTFVANYFFRKFWLIDYGLFAEETFADLRKNHKTFFRKHFLLLK